MPDLAPATCACIERLNEALANEGRAVMVDTSLVWTESTDTQSVRIKIGFAKTDPRNRKRLPVLIARFCPLCATPYQATEPAAEGATP